MTDESRFQVKHLIADTDQARYEVGMRRVCEAFPIFQYSFRKTPYVGPILFAVLTFPIEDGEGVPLDILQPIVGQSKAFMDKLFLARLTLEDPDEDCTPREDFAWMKASI